MAGAPLPSYYSGSHRRVLTAPAPKICATCELRETECSSPCLHWCSEHSLRCAVSGHGNASVQKSCALAVKVAARHEICKYAAREQTDRAPDCWQAAGQELCPGALVL